MTEPEVPGLVLATILVQLIELGGGYTMIENVRGGWLSQEGKGVQTDTSQLIWVIVPRAKVAALKALVRKIGFQLKQEAMYFETLEVEVEFIDCRDVRRRRA